MDNQSAQDSQNVTHNTQQASGQNAPQAVQPQSQLGNTVSDQGFSGTPHKEHAPLTEQVRIADPVEAQPEMSQELKEAGVEVRQDEARLDITREHQSMGIQHSPHTTPVQEHIEKPKVEFPMSYEQAEVAVKESSVWEPLRWLATLVMKQMKMKGITEQK